VVWNVYEMNELLLLCGAEAGEMKGDEMRERIVRHERPELKGDELNEPAASTRLMH